MKSGVNRLQGRNSNYMDFNPDGSTIVSSGKSEILINTNETSTSPVTTPSIPSTIIIPNPTKITGSFETIVDIIPITSSLSSLITSSIDIESTSSLTSEQIFAIEVPDEEEIFSQLYGDIEVIPEIDLETNIVIDNTQPNIEISLPKTRISASTFQKAYDQAEKLEPGFKAKLQKVAKAIGANEIDLVKVMYKESGLNNNARNPNTCSAGLIQFTPDNKIPQNKNKIGCDRGKLIGGKLYSMNQILKLTRIQQLDLVELYFKGGKPLKTIYDLYLYTFYPLARGKADSFILGSEDTKNPNWKFKLAEQNKGITKFSNIQINGKKLINLAAFKAYVNTFS
jgi:hypothetical protein